MVSVVDESVANVTKALHKKGILNNTIIVFTTDNGGPAHGMDGNVASNMPLRGMKHTMWEGGVRGTGLIWSTLLKTTGVISDNMMQVEDWLPTLLSVADYDMTSLPDNIYGIDQWDQLVNRIGQKGVRTEMLHNIDISGPNEYALRVEDWKLIYSKGGSTRTLQGWYDTPQYEHDTLTHVRELEQTIKGRLTNYSSTFEQSYDLLDVANAQFSDPIKAGKASKNSGIKPEVVDLSAPSHLFRSDVDDVLKSIGRNGPKGSPLVINCGVKPANASTNCDVAKAPCLYNIKHDPCEFNNRAFEFPQYVTEMLDRLKRFEEITVEPKNKALDPNGFPGNHGGIWTSWLTL